MAAMPTRPVPRSIGAAARFPPGRCDDGPAAPADAVLAGQTGQRGIAGVASGGLDALARPQRDVDAGFGQGQRQALRQHAHLPPPFVGAGLQPVVHVEQRDADAELPRHGRRMHGEHGRVRAAAHRHRDARRTLGQRQQRAAQGRGQLGRQGQRRRRIRPGRLGGAGRVGGSHEGRRRGAWPRRRREAGALRGLRRALPGRRRRTAGAGRAAPRAERASCPGAGAGRRPARGAAGGP